MKTCVLELYDRLDDKIHSMTRKIKLDSLLAITAGKEHNFSTAPFLSRFFDLSSTSNEGFNVINFDARSKPHDRWEVLQPHHQIEFRFDFAITKQSFYKGADQNYITGMWGSHFFESELMLILKNF